MLPSEENPDYPSYVNRINTPFYSMENAGFVLEMSGGKGQSTNESFARYAMPHISIQDADGNVVGEYGDNGDGNLDFTLNNGTITLTMNETLKAGDYKLMLGKDLCFLEADCSSGRTLGYDIAFEFTVEDGERETTISLDRSAYRFLGALLLVYEERSCRISRNLLKSGKPDTSSCRILDLVRFL